MKSLRRQGVGYALEVIAERSRADAGHRDKIDDFMTELVNVADGGELTIGNLNYDSMAMASLCDLYGSRLCDMAWGYREAPFDLRGDGVLRTGRPLRSAPSQFPNFAQRPIRLLHLHGSLTWLRHPSTGVVYRFEIEDLRGGIVIDEATGLVRFAGNHWEQWRKGATEWEPQVVLTNQAAKSDLIAEPPFKLGYDALYASLLRADRWLIAGYSFRDECVNTLLADAWRNRKTIPEIMVVTFGDELTQEQILDGIGYDPFAGDPTKKLFIHICRHGIEVAPKHNPWRNWAGSTELRQRKGA